jgi:hypothetical protein
MVFKAHLKCCLWSDVRFLRANLFLIDMPPFRAFLVLALLLLFQACQIAGPDEPGTSSVAEHKAKFDARYSATYSFNVMRGCFCANGGEHWVQVVDGEVVAAVRVFDQKPVPADQLEWLETMDEVFDMIERAESEADRIDVTWSELGYPAEFFIDWIEEAADDEMGMTISNVVPGVQLPD